MSVHSRKRKESELEFYKNGKELRAEFTRYLMSEKYVPKRYSFVFRLPGIDLVREMMEEITAANTIYPTTPEQLLKRKEHQQSALIKCEQIIQHIQWMNDTLQSVTLTSLDRVSEMAIYQATLLRKWRDSSKIMEHKKGANS